MPKGQFFALTGTLQRSDRFSPYLSLHVIKLTSGSGWYLNIRGNTDHLIERTVHIEGVRWDFAIIDVDRIWAEGDPRPVFLRERIRAWWASG